MAFTNRVRLPIKVSKPQYNEERQVYRHADGVEKTLSVIITKSYEGITDLLPEKIHERLKIALAHDTVSIEGERYVGGVSQNGDYNIEWPDFLDYPLGQAKFKVNVTPFDASNNNCASCDNFIQIETVDDDIGTVTENEIVTVPVLDNDVVCCYPVTLSIITFDSAYVQSVTVNANNELVITMKNNLVTQNNVQLVTYRAQCENGQYDEAAVIADVTGSSVADCLSVTNQTMLTVGSTTAQAAWNSPDPVPACGFDWQLFDLASPGSPVQTGNTSSTTLDLASLTPSTNYRLDIYSDCCDANSNAASVEFTTNPASGTEACGQYNVCYDNPSGIPSFTSVAFINCSTGEEEGRFINNHDCMLICMLQSSPGNPVYYVEEHPSNTTITYIGLC